MLRARARSSCRRRAYPSSRAVFGANVETVAPAPGARVCASCGGAPFNGRRRQELRGLDDFRRRVWYGHALPSMVPVYKRLSSAERRVLYQRIIARCAPSPGKPPAVVVFDLDGTLMDNRPRTAVILQELAAELRSEAHSSAEILAAARSEELAYLLGDSLRRLGLEHPELLARAEQFWRERFFSDHYLKHDIAVAGSVAFARACYEAGAIIVYFTGRDLPLMGIGSFQSLRDLGYPIGVVGTELVCKPDAKIPDEAFKREEGPKLARVGHVVAAFDNEPGNCNAFLEMCPDADVIFVDTQHLPGAPPLDARVHVVEDFTG